MLRQRLIRALTCLAAIQAILVIPGSLPASAQSPETTSTTSLAQKASAASVAVSPPTAELNVAPGASATQKISLINGTDQPRVFNAFVQNAIAKGDEGQADLTPDEGPYSLSAWMKVSPENITIGPNATADFQVTINVPKDAGGGGHYGAVVFSPVDSKSGNSTQVAVVPQVSSLILVTVPGDIVEKASLTKFSADKSFYSKGPVTFTALIKNDGNTVVKPSGTIAITNVFGQKVKVDAADTLKFDQQRVLPGASRKFTVTWKQGNLLGPYTAKLTWTYGTIKPATATATTKVWGAPTTIIAIVVGVLLALFLLVWLPRKRLKKAMKAFKDAGADDDKPAAKAKPSEPAETETTEE